MKKRWYIIAILVILLAVTCFGTAFASDYTYYVNEDGTAIITGYTGHDKHLVFPEMLDGHLITSVYMNALAFYANSHTVSVTFPENVTIYLENTPNSDDNFFSLWSALTEINVSPNDPNFSSVDGVLFDKAVTRLISYPRAKAASDYSIPSSVTTLNHDAFVGAQYLTSVTIPEQTASLNTEYHGTMYYTGINGIEIWGSGNPFARCSSLTDIIVAESNKSFSSIEGVLFNKDGTTLISYPCGREKSDYSIPYGVSKIGDYAFSGSRLLSAIHIPASVTTIECGAFSYCSSLTAAEIPKGVKRFGDSVFAECDALVTLSLSRTITSIGSYAFYSCDALESVSIFGDVRYIGDYAFANCNSLSSVVVALYVDGIYSNAFSNCEALSSIVLGTSVKHIYDDAFENCPNLVFEVVPDSEAEKYAKRHDIPYRYASKDKYIY